MRIYISGAITGTDDYMERFSAAQKRIEAQGHTVMNPALVCSNMPADTTYEEYMEVCMCLLDMCEAIYLLKGWEKSSGATREHDRAVRNQMKVIRESEKNE